MKCFRKGMEMNTGLILAGVVCVMFFSCGCQAPTTFKPPPGAKIIYQCNFDDGKTDGWDGELTAENAMPGSKFALKIASGKKRAKRKVKIPLTEETVLSFYVHTTNNPQLFVQCLNVNRKSNCRSPWYFYPNRDYGRWVHVRLPLAATLIDSGNKSACAAHKWVSRVGDTLGDLQIHVTAGKSVLVDNIVVYSMDAAGKLAQSQAELKQLRAERTKALSARFAPPGAAKAWSMDRLVARAKELAGKDDLTWAEANEFHEQVAGLRAVIGRAREYYAPAGAAFGKDPDFAIGTQHAMARISDLHPMHPFGGEVSGSVRLYSARREYESFQAVVLPFARDLKKVNVRFSTLKRLGGKGQIAAANCTWRTQPYVQPLPSYAYPGYDWLAPKPDPLLPGEPFDLSMDRCKPLWITVYTPPDAPAGEYEGRMTVTAEGARPHTLKIKLRVWDYEIPLTGRFRCQTNITMGPVAKFYGRRVDQKWRREWYEFLLKYRFSPTAQYARGFSPDPDDIAFCKARGCNVWILGGLSGLKDVPVAEYRKRHEIAKKHGILPYCHVYIGDETSDFALMRKKANILHANFPGLKVMIGGSRPRKELIGYIDIWDPTMSIATRLYGFDPKEIEQASQRGEEVMWYVACGPTHPYPNVMMGDPLFASRMLFWLTWKYRITGFEYYCFAIWGKNPTIKPRWPESPWHCYSFRHTNGDGQLCYPGPGGHPASSVRLENIRDGIEDWEAMFILEGAAEALKRAISAGDVKKESAVQVQGKELTLAELLRRASTALALDESFCKDVTHWSLDPAELQRRRNEVSRLIEAIVGLVGKERFEAHQARRVADRRALEARRLEENRQRALKELKATTKPQ